MSGVEKIFRVFVGSTFADMVGERTVLQERVFPRLEAYCRERGGRFQAIDLRWGVSARAARDRRTMGICLEEIRRCRQVSPALNFLVLLGDRFGWKPIPAEIDAGDFERLCAASPDDWEELRRAYRRDDNRDTSRKGILRTIRSSEGISENRGEIGIRLRKLVVCQV